MEGKIMKRILSTISVCLTFFALIACNEDQIDTFGDQNYIHFKQESKKVYRFSFATVPGVTEYEYKIPMTLIGKALSEDKEYGIEVVTEGAEILTTATSASYKLPESIVFKKDVYEDTLKIVLTDNAELAQEKCLVLKVVDNDNFKVGPVKYQTAVLYLSNYLVQPDWWDDEMTSIFLGEYSDIKYQQFIIATGITDMSQMTSLQVTAYVSTFVYYLRDLDVQGTPVYESDNQTKVLDTIPYNKNI